MIKQYFSASLFTNGNKISLVIMDKNELLYAQKTSSLDGQKVANIINKYIPKNNSYVSISFLIENNSNADISIFDIIINEVNPDQIIRVDPAEIAKEAYAEITPKLAEKSLSFEEIVIFSAQKLNFNKNVKLDDFELAYTYLCARQTWLHTRITEALKILNVKPE